MHALVTGCSGFVGQALCRRLLADGAFVTGADVRPPVWTVPAADGRFRFAAVDLTRDDAWAATDWATIDVVFHLAAAGVKASGRDWETCIRVNIIGTDRLLQAMSHAARPPRLVYAHTFYEDHLTDLPALALSPYAATKFQATRLVEAFAARCAAPVVGAKLFQVYGPGDAPGNLVPYILATLLRGEKALLGSGRGRRDWIALDDLVAGLLACAMVDKAGWSDYELGSGALHSIREVAERLAALVGVPPTRLEFEPSRDRGDAELVAVATHAPPGWRPCVDLQDGLARLVNDARSCADGSQARNA